MVVSECPSSYKDDWGLMTFSGKMCTTGGDWDKVGRRL